MLVFVILECVLYHKQKRFICMLKCGINMLKTRRYDSALSSHYFFSTAAKFLRTESVKCSARAVIAKSRARHVHVMSLNLLTSRKSPLI